MPLQSSGAISLLDIQNEFGGSNPIGINEYYGAGGAPSSGTISIGDFYGRSAGLSVQILHLAGGGSAFSDTEDGGYAGGSGGGGLLISTGNISGSVPVIVGGSNSNSSTTLGTALAGGRTSARFTSSFSDPGGSGGGAGTHSNAGAGTPGQGNPGGAYPGVRTGGGGGQSSSGLSGTSGGNGGSGYYISNFKAGPSIMVAFGGGGCELSTSSVAPSGDGVVYGGSSFTPTPTNRGGGTGVRDFGGTWFGGSGLVIVRYPGSTRLATGGNSNYSAVVGGTTYYFHEFTSSGTISYP